MNTKILEPDFRTLKNVSKNYVWFGKNYAEFVCFEQQNDSVFLKTEL